MTQAPTQEPREFTPASLGPTVTGREVPGNLEVFAAGFFEGAGSALTTVLNRTVSVSVVEIVSLSPAELLAATPLPWVLVEAPYQRGISGTHWIVFGTASARAFREPLTGDEAGPGGEILPAAQESMRDTFNQILAAAGPPLMPLFGRSVAFAPVTIHVVEDADALPPELAPPGERVWVVRAQATAADGLRGDLALTIGSGLAREILALGAGDGAGQGAVAPRRGEAFPSKIDLILDVTLPVTVELGRARMQVQDVLKLAPGSVIELDKAAGDPVDLYINDRAIAKGEVVIIDENFGVRLTSIVTATERIKTLR